ncbi:hypothetical protein [Epilithonimonas zeae]|uniref:hypothetical protein n=1 Tax=Epilithonimonas zeae TaxID=1416779 RepID=UPI00200E9D46|nr:hypothetical protein [Epilithonimonas zeae]UQB68224.1 hypothetical protein KI430_14500 [Epilithonimonas zeae]
MKSKWTFSFFFLLPVLFVLCLWNYNNRVYDWDMPGYIGSMYTSQYPNNPEKVKELTFSSIQKEAPIDQYNDVIGKNPKDVARQYFEKSTKAFSEQLPYFQIKVGYNLAITILYKIGFTAPMSVLFLSLLSYFFSGILLFFVFKIIFPNNILIVFFITLAILLLPPMTYMARVSTPDMFILQFLLIFMIGLFSRWKRWIMFSILFAITFIRPDYITFTLTYLITDFLFNFYERKKINFNVILQTSILFFLYIFIVKFYHYPGWKNLFYDSFICRRPIISEELADFGITDYLRILLRKIIYFKKVSLIAFGSLGLIFYLSKDKWTRFYSVFIFANIYIKFVFFPHSSGLRFFFGFILLLLIMLMYSISQRYNRYELDKNS